MELATAVAYKDDVPDLRVFTRRETFAEREIRAETCSARKMVPTIAAVVALVMLAGCGGKVLEDGPGVADAGAQTFDARPPATVTFEACYETSVSTYPSTTRCTVRGSASGPCSPAGFYAASLIYACFPDNGEKRQPALPHCFETTIATTNDGTVSFICEGALCADAEDSTCAGKAYVCPAGSDLSVFANAPCAIDGQHVCCP